jgi:hypothetical protein
LALPSPMPLLLKRDSGELSDVKAPQALPRGWKGFAIKKEA